MVLVLITCGTQVYMWGFVDLFLTTSLYLSRIHVPTGLKLGLYSVGHIGHEKAHGEMVRPDVASEAIRRLN